MNRSQQQPVPGFSGFLGQQLDRSLRVLHERQIRGLDWNRLERLSRQQLLLVFHAFSPKRRNLH
jgi:hypothetical protein